MLSLSVWLILPLHAIRNGNLRSVSFGAMEGLVSAPSFHVAGGLMVSWALRHVRWLLPGVLVVNVSLCLATVMTGTHYVVDVLLSLVMVAGSVFAWRWGHRRLLLLNDRGSTAGHSEVMSGAAGSGGRDSTITRHGR